MFTQIAFIKVMLLFHGSVKVFIVIWNNTIPTTNYEKHMTKMFSVNKIEKRSKYILNKSDILARIYLVDLFIKTLKLGNLFHSLKSVYNTC